MSSARVLRHSNGSVMMFGEKWLLRHLEEKDIDKSFGCGDPDLDNFLLNDSLSYKKNMLAITYVLEISNKIMAYFSLANDSISIRDFNAPADFNRFRKKRFVNSKRIKSYPAVKICRFAVSEDAKYKGIGSVLLDAIKMAFLRNNRAACRFLTVDAYNSAVSFYERNGFMTLQQNDSKSATNLMFYDLINAL